MKRFFFGIALLAIASIATGCGSAETSIKVISYNIRLSGNGSAASADGEHFWEYRKQASINMINDEKPTIFGLQEACADQMKFMAENLPQYDHYGIGRDDGKSKGEFMAIFYDKEQVEMLESGTFWLSQTPDEVSYGWDADCRRTCTWSILKSKSSGKKFAYLNTHLDHRGKVAREESIKLILSKMEELIKEPMPIFLTADFNAATDSPIFDPLKAKMLDARAAAPNADTRGTYNAWGKAKEGIVIDHIFYSGAEAKSFRVLRDKNYGAPIISDHYPIVLEATF